MVILNFFNLNQAPEVDYYKASLTIRNIVNEILDPDINLLKLNMNNEDKQRYVHLDDKFDEKIQNSINVCLYFT